MRKPSKKRTGRKNGARKPNVSRACTRTRMGARLGFNPEFTRIWFNLTATLGNPTVQSISVHRQARANHCDDRLFLVSRSPWPFPWYVKKDTYLRKHSAFTCNYTSRIKWKDKSISELFTYGRYYLFFNESFLKIKDKGEKCFRKHLFFHC